MSSRILTLTLLASLALPASLQAQELDARSISYTRATLKNVGKDCGTFPGHAVKGHTGHCCPPLLPTIGCNVKRLVHRVRNVLHCMRSCICGSMACRGAVKGAPKGGGFPLLSVQKHHGDCGGCTSCGPSTPQPPYPSPTPSADDPFLDDPSPTPPSHQEAQYYQLWEMDRPEQSLSQSNLAPVIDMREPQKLQVSSASPLDRADEVKTKVKEVSVSTTRDGAGRELGIPVNPLRR